MRLLNVVRRRSIRDGYVKSCARHGLQERYFVMKKDPIQIARAKNRAFSQSEREAVYRAIFERRDVRRNFLPHPIPSHVVRRLLMAAHHAGSVGFMQPWDFIVIQQRATKRDVKQLFIDANERAIQQYRGTKAALYRELKLEGIEEAPSTFV